MARQIAQPPLDEEQPRERRLRMSYDEFLAWSDEDTHAEWVNGEVIAFMPPTIRHQFVAGFLQNLLSSYARLFDLGVVLSAPCEMRALPDGPAREPDLLFVAREHLGRLTPERLAGPADLVIEIVSDSSARRDQVEKFREYREAGVREYWLADARPGRHHFSPYRLNARREYEAIAPDAAGRCHSTVLPGFWLDPAWLWQDPLPDPLTLLATIAPAALRRALAGTGAAPRATAGGTESTSGG